MDNCSSQPAAEATASRQTDSELLVQRPRELDTVLVLRGQRCTVSLKAHLHMPPARPLSPANYGTVRGGRSDDARINYPTAAVRIVSCKRRIGRRTQDAPSYTVGARIGAIAHGRIVMEIIRTVGVWMVRCKQRTTWVHAIYALCCRNIEQTV